MIVCYHRAAFLRGAPHRIAAIQMMPPEEAARLCDGTSASVWMVPGTFPLEG